MSFRSFMERKTNHYGKASNKDTVVRRETMRTCILKLLLFNISVKDSSAVRGCVSSQRSCKARNPTKHFPQGS